MTWFDDKSAVLLDGSIINFEPDGTVKFYPSKLWKKFKHDKNMKFDSKEQAIEVWTIAEEQLKLK